MSKTGPDDSIQTAPAHAPEERQGGEGPGEARAVAPPMEPLAPALPAIVPAPSPPPRRRLRRSVLLLLLLALAAGGGAYWWTQSEGRLPPGIVVGNGRIEADEIDISTKFAGRIAELRAD